jgi:hypothetical protein
MIKNLVFSYNNDEIMPCLLGYGHNLKEHNVCKCESNLLFENNNFKIIYKKVFHKNKNIDIYITYNKNEFLRGFLYIDDKEYIVNDYNCYKSLQVEKYCYDNIDCIMLGSNIFI